MVLAERSEFIAVLHFSTRALHCNTDRFLQSKEACLMIHKTFSSLRAYFLSSVVFRAIILVVLVMFANVGSFGQTPKELTIAFLPQNDISTFLPDAEKLAAELSRRLGLPVKVYVPSDYAAAVEALRFNHAQVAFVPSWPGVMANRVAGARFILAEVRNGKTYYYSCWYARADAAISTLADLRGKKVAFSSPLSSSGYLFPVAKLVEEGLLKDGQADLKSFFGEILYSGGYEATLQAIARGHVDAGAASEAAYELYLTPEQRRRVKIIARQGPVPTHGVVVHPSLSREFVESLRTALLSYSSEQDKALLKKLYGAESFAPVTHEEHVSHLYRAEQLTGYQYKTAQRP
jgi:phosphonate transport system substrate-binding protein